MKKPLRHHDNKYNDTQHNDTQLNDTQHGSEKCFEFAYDAEYLFAVCLYAKCHYYECRYGECGGATTCNVFWGKAKKPLSTRVNIDKKLLLLTR
jgi:hypothetical protein